MKYLQRDVYRVLAGVLFISVMLLSCAKKREQRIVLDYTGNKGLQEVLAQAAEKNSWQVVQGNSKGFWEEDFLQQHSAVVITFSGLNHLGYRDLNALKRFLEAGGGGVVAVKDTVLTQQGWPWLQQWNELPVGKESRQDNGQVYILDKDFSAEALTNAVTYAIGNNEYPQYKKATTLEVPDSTHYTRIVLTEGLDEPLQMEILPNNNVLFVERKGGVKIYDAATKQIKNIGKFNVFSGIEDGLLGVVLDPNYKQNNWAYFYYAPAGVDSIDRLSRFELIKDSLILSSEKVLLEVPTQRTYCCHSAGGVAFGPDGLLYISVGDNTNAEQAETYVPVDERPGHELADDQATAANTNDLRGKILRIKPEANGTYSIPEGNLFKKGTPKTRPEIYIMGLRNPYRFTIDQKTNILYWGEVGPDTRVMSKDGEYMSFDEFNIAKKPGFYGWPYFLGDNEAYPMWNFETKQEGPRKDPARPINDSRNNTGLRELPPAQPAMIWYGRQPSKHFPLVGSGGASAMSGPVYYSDLFPNAPYKLSKYYDGKLFIYEWIRHWVIAVTLDENGHYLRMEPFLEHLPFAAPIDMKFGPDGAIYTLEYGTNWFAPNSDAKLVRIEYHQDSKAAAASKLANTPAPTAPAPAQLQIKTQYVKGQDMVASQDCKSCHTVSQKSVGPSFMDVSRHYQGKAGAADQLVKKIIEGGSGNWGSYPMPGHPGLSSADAHEMVNFILSISPENPHLPLKDSLPL
jgi:cytochrome c